jgi:hypothetical protein
MATLGLGRIGVSALLTWWMAAALCAPQIVHADDSPRIAVFQTARDDAALRELAQALDPVLLAALNQFPSLHVGSRPALDLPAMQLAIDCVGDSAECLHAVAKQAATEGIVAPLLRRVGRETVVALLYFDARGTGVMKGVTRRYAGDNFEAKLFDEVPAMLRELFGIAPESNQPAAAPAAGPAAGAQAPAPAAQASTTLQPTASPRASPPVVPIVVTAVGVVLVGVGAAFGLAAKSSEDVYARLAVNTPAQARAAEDKLGGGKTQATLANVGFITGGLAVALGVTLWVLHGKSGSGEASAALAPSVGFGHAGLTLSGHWSAGSL